RLRADRPGECRRYIRLAHAHRELQLPDLRGADQWQHVTARSRDGRSESQADDAPGVAVDRVDAGAEYIALPHLRDTGIDPLAQLFIEGEPGAPRILGWILSNAAQESP